MACKKGIRKEVESAKERRKKPKPALLKGKVGDVTAVLLGDDEFCYLRRYRFGYAVLPFLSRAIERDASQFPSLTPAFFVHVWVYADDPTPMTHITNIPFGANEDSSGPPMYYPQDLIAPCYKIHGIFNGIFSIIKPVSEAEVRGLEEFHRYQPADLRDVLFSRRPVWDYIPASHATPTKA